jgi:type I restriction-modification system, S subunit, putative
MIPPFCVLIGLAGQGKTRGTAAYNYISLCTNQSIAAILPNDKYDSLYLYYVVDSKYDYLRLLSSGDGGRGGLNKNLLNSLEIVFPKTIAEQRAIAEALSDIDGLIAALDKKIAKKRLIKQGAMQQLLTGKKRLPGFTDSWVEKKLGEILDYEQPQPYLVVSTDYVDSGIPVLTAGKSRILGYTTEQFGIYNKLPVIIFDDFTTDSKYISYPFKVKSSAMKVLSLKNNDYDLRLVYELMQQIDFPLKDHQRYWISEYSQLTISIPKDREEQTAIATILTDMDKEIADLEAKRDKYSLLKSGMMQKLLTGQIRLKINRI